MTSFYLPAGKNIGLIAETDVFGAELADGQGFDQGPVSGIFDYEIFVFVPFS